MPMQAHKGGGGVTLTHWQPGIWKEVGYHHAAAALPRGLPPYPL